MVDTVAIGLGAVAFLAALTGVVGFLRAQARRLQADSRQAADVLDLIPTGSSEIRWSARSNRPGSSVGRRSDQGTVELATVSRLVHQEAEIYLEHHRIALKHHAAYQQASLWAGLLGFTVIVVGAVLTYFEGLEVGVVTAVAGAVPSAAGALLYQQANTIGARAAENLRRLEDSVRRFNTLQTAIAAFGEISDPQTRDDLYEILGLQLLFPDDSLDKLRGKTAKRNSHKP